MTLMSTSRSYTLKMELTSTWIPRTKMIKRLLEQRATMLTMMKTTRVRT